MSEIIAIIGGPGVGKTFLVDKLQKKFNSKKIIENTDFPKEILEGFKNNTKQVEILLWFRNKCINEMLEADALRKKGKTVVMDTYYLSNELHITTMVKGLIQEILLEQAKIDRITLPKPDKVIFLDASEEKIKRMTLERGRDFDTNEEFLKRNMSIRKAHKDFYEKNKEDFIYINRDNLDFEKEEDLKILLEKLNK